MFLFVGSSNPVKINAVTIAASETWPEAQVQGFDVPSGIPEQPFGDQQTRLGAQNRAKAALQRGIDSIENGIEFRKEHKLLGVGLEGGVVEQYGELWSTVWVVVTADTETFFESNGARFKVPDQIAKPILAGEEMGPVVAAVIGDSDVRKKQGAIGVVTNNFVDRTEEYSSIAKLALGLWYGREWHLALD